MTDGTETSGAPGGGVWLAAPLVIFLTVAALFGISLQKGDPSKLPSALIGKAVPVFAFTAVDGLGVSAAGFDQGALTTGQVSVVNFFASWCAPCVDEHPQLAALKARGVAAMIGVNVKDEPAAARQFLNRFGNPYGVIGADRAGRGSIEWGVYGTPETFIVDGKGVITFKFVGPITKKALEDEILPAIERAKTAAK